MSFEINLKYWYSEYQPILVLLKHELGRRTSQYFHKSNENLKFDAIPKQKFSLTFTIPRYFNQLIFVFCSLVLVIWQFFISPQTMKLDFISQSSSKSTLPVLTFVLFQVECGEDWVTFDNSCYKLESNPGQFMTQSDGQTFCAQTYGADLMVPDSKEEAIFIGNYLTSIQVMLSNKDV